MNTLAWGQIINQNMARESRHTTGDTPDMQIMDSLDTCNLFQHIFLQLFERNVFWDGLKENMRRITNNTPSTKSEEQCNGNREQGVYKRRPCQQYNPTSHNHSRRYTHIAENMQCSSTHIHIILLFS